jgi:urease gamma subunit
VRLFVADAPSGDWHELTDGDQPTLRVAASDLQQARRARARIRARGQDVAVILDITVAVAGDFRSARSVLGPADHTVHYAGTVDGLAGLISDIARADVADGVTLIAAGPRQDVRSLGRDVLHRLASQDQPRAS